MLKSSSAPSPEDLGRSSDQDSQQLGPALPTEPRTFVETPHQALLARLSSSAAPRPFVRRQFSPVVGRALEILGHAIEYLADEYSVDVEDKGPLGSADPRIEAIQILKALNRAVYYSTAEVQPPFRRIRRWVLGSRTP